MQPMRFPAAAAARLGRAAADRLPELTTLVLVIVLAYSSAGVVWRIADAPAAAVSARDARPDAQPAAESEDPGSDAVERLLAADLFGTAEAGDAPAQQAANAPETGLDLTLSGIIASGNDRVAHAIIAVNDKDEETFSVGETLTGNAVIDSIHPDRVLIRRNGALEALRLPESETVGETGPRQRRSRRDSSIDMDSLRDQLLQDPESLSQMIRFRPVYRDGKFQGYRVYPGQDRELFGQLGLQPGDVVREVNGVTLDTQNKGLDLLETLDRADELQLSVQRGGKTQRLTAPLDN